MRQYPAYVPALFGAALLAATPAAPQDLRPDEAAILPRIIDHQCLELIEDLNGCENVILVASGEDAADLLILPDYRNTDTTAPILVARGFAWAGPMWGQWPSISQRDNGSLVITAEQFGIGRWGWSEDLTLAWRDGRFVVAGLTRTEIDRGVAFAATCDVNLLTGQWNVDMTTYAEKIDSGRIKGETIAARDWTADRPRPAVCDAASEQLYNDAVACTGDNPPEGCLAAME
jgi:hypothetical protein